MEIARIYYLNKDWDAAGFGHAAILLPVAGGGVVYCSFFAARRFVPFCKGTLLVKEFACAAEGLAYATSEGYTREVHWLVDGEKVGAAREAVEGFAMASGWRLLSRNCWDAVLAGLVAAGIKAPRGLWPNRIFERCKKGAEGWGYL